MKRALLLAVVLLTLAASDAEAHTAHRLHLRAAPARQVWRYAGLVPRAAGIAMALYVNGREVDHRGWAHPNGCEYTVEHRRLTATFKWCGGRHFSLRYLGSTAFTVVYWFN